MVQHGNGSAVYRRIGAANDMAKETEDGAGKNITDNIKEIFFQGDISQDTLDEIMGDNIRKDNEALLVCLGEKLKKSGTTRFYLSWARGSAYQRGSQHGTGYWTICGIVRW